MTGVTPALPFWYEINVYDSVLGTVVTDVRLFQCDPALADAIRALAKKHSAVLLANLPDFWELKRTRTSGPDLESVPTDALQLTGTR